jgi:hypothetical protein
MAGKNRGKMVDRPPENDGPGYLKKGRGDI